MVKSKFLICAVVLINIALLGLLGTGAARSAVQTVCISELDGDWSNPAIWSCNARPGVLDDVIIDTEVTITDIERIHDITITTNGLLVSQGNLFINGDLQNEGFFDAGTYTVTFDSLTGPQVISYTESTDLEFYNLRLENNGALGAIVLDNLVEVNNDASIASGALVNIGDNFLSVAGVFSSSGTLRQTRMLSGTVLFPATQQFASLASESFLGASITTVNGLGNVTFTMQSQAGDCTDQPMSLHALRCFTIEAENPGLTATLRLYVLRSELNGITATRVAPYRHVPGGGWIKLENVLTGTRGSEYVFAEGITPGFSSFLLGVDTQAPTAVDLNRMEGKFSALNHHNTRGLLALLTLTAIWVGRQVRRGRQP